MNGLLIIDKPSNYTSRDIVNIVSKFLNTKKVGHTGTLDPLATGVLVVAINEGLKIVNLLSNDKKEYIATVTCGILTDTLDITGNVLKEHHDFTLDKHILISTLSRFLGKTIQEVPIYSAVKVNGKKLYEYARNDEKVNLPKKEIEIFEIELLECESKSFSFRVVVSKGTYIRSLIRDIGEELGILCTMSSLRRTKAGNFSIDEANELTNIESGNYKIISIKEALSNYKIVEADLYLENRIRNGSILENRYNENNIVFINNSGKVLAIYEIYSKDKDKIKPLKIFNL